MTQVFIDCEWRPVVGYEGSYAISEYGEVKSLSRYVPYRTTGVALRKERLLTWCDLKGYPTVTLRKDNEAKRIYVHKLVSQAFIGPRPEGEQVRHIDGDTYNAHYSNLVYGTAKDNAADREGHGNTPRGSLQGNSKLRDEEVIEIKRRLQTEKIRHIARDYDVHESVIGKIKANKLWKHVN